jgi:hypothetical protein
MHVLEYAADQPMVRCEMLQSVELATGDGVIGDRVMGDGVMGDGVMGDGVTGVTCHLSVVTCQLSIVSHIASSVSSVAVMVFACCSSRLMVAGRSPDWSPYQPNWA